VRAGDANDGAVRAVRRHPERIALALDDQGRNVDRIELREPALLRAAGRVEREGKTQDPARIGGGGGAARDAGAGRPTTCQQEVEAAERALEQLGHDCRPRRVELTGRSRASPPSDPVWLLHERDADPGRACGFGRGDEVGSFDPAARTVTEYERAGRGFDRMNVSSREPVRSVDLEDGTSLAHHSRQAMTSRTSISASGFQAFYGLNVVTGLKVVLRSGEIDEPFKVVLGFVEAWHIDVSRPSRPASFQEADLRLANRGGARIAAAQIAVILERRGAIERALRAIAPDASLAAAAKSVPWAPLRQLFDAFAEIKGVGFAKMTKALHPKRPALIPILDSVVQKYLVDDDPGAEVPFGERALTLVDGYKRDLDRNRAAVQAVRRELTRRGHRLTEVRILDLLIWSVAAP
jgi:Family of unknown function (DUF6308)